MATQLDAVLHTSPSKIGNIAIWVVQVLLAAAFLMAGSSKLAGNEQMISMFQQIGLGQWFRYLTGIIEIAGAMMLVIPRTALFGGSLLALTMIGGIATHLFLVGGSPVPAIVLLALASVVVWYRRPAFSTDN